MQGDIEALPWYWKLPFGVVALIFSLMFLVYWFSSLANKQYANLIDYTTFMGVCSLAFTYWSFASLYQGAASSTSQTALSGLARAMVISFWTASALHSVLAFLQAAISDGGYANSSNANWHYVTRDGSHGAIHHAASVRDVFEHRHGHGSWQRQQESQQNFLTVLHVIAIPFSIYAPFYLRSKGVFVTGGLSNLLMGTLSGVVAIIAACLVGLLEAGWVIALGLSLVLAALCWWSGWTPWQFLSL
ncbi:MAG: hypothetical protein HOP19_17450 [Acidobacteria bacterium]|nr:hypothetical protein [Acidobacteriota bacterium]